MSEPYVTRWEAEVRPVVDADDAFEWMLRCFTSHRSEGFAYHRGVVRGHAAESVAFERLYAASFDLAETALALPPIES